MKNGAVTLVLSALALGVAVLAWTREPETQPQRTSDQSARISALERKVEKLTLELNYAKSAESATAPREATDVPIPAPTGPAAVEIVRDAAVAPEGSEENAALAAIVDDAVDRKTKAVIDDMRLKANKKPDIEAFAGALELDKSQRAATERIVAEGQRKLHELLNTPTADGTVLMDELVDIVAKGMAQPGKDHGFGGWIGRLVSETVPGTNVTYATQLESVKTAMRTDFRREWTKEQYREFEEWKVDPTEIQNVADSPNVELMKRITDRARTFGADLPDEK